ncbi:MAG: multiheme c-type cytochrome, partial [Roseiarcus sp.]
MSGNIRKVMDVSPLPASDRIATKRARRAGGTNTARFAARLSRLIVAGAFAFAQPVFAEATLGVPLRSSDDGYAALQALLQASAAGQPSGAGLAQSSGARDDYAVLTDFVRVADASGTVALPLTQGEATAPDDAIHAGVRGAAASGGDAYSVLADFVRTVDGAAPVSAATQVEPPADAIHSGLARPTKTGSDDYSLLSEFAADKDGAAPLVVAAVTRAPKTPKSETADDEPATYVGSQACVKCHRDQFGSFGQTLHGDIFLKNPRTDQEKLGCETCHGPGSKHAKTKETDSGAPGDIISFSKDSPRSVADRNAICLSCHEKGDRTYWDGSTHETQGLACTNCHQIMEKVSVKNQMVK